VLGALHNHLNSVTFFCHCVLKTDCKYRMNFGLYNIFFLSRVFHLEKIHFLVLKTALIRGVLKVAHSYF
jgi:hypothetical protein